MHDLQQRFDKAHEVTLAAGRLALDYFGRFDTLEIQSKGVQDMASEADLETEQLIRDELLQAFPNDGFLGEETGRLDLDSTEGLWVVDPIDGTQPFVNGLTDWCVSIAFVQAGILQFGLVYRPATDELFEGGRWFAATRNGRPISPSQATSLSEGLTYLGASPRVGPDQVVPVLDRLLHARGLFIRYGSGALGLCDVACGRIIGYVEAHINAWDCLGAVAVLEAAGARVSDYLTPVSLLKGNAIVAGGPAVFDQLVEVLGTAAQQR